MSDTSKRPRVSDYWLGVSAGATWRAIAVAAVAFSLIARPVCSQGSVTPEFRSKATFLANFPSFVDWPENAFTSALAPFTICVRGDFSFGTVLAEIARGASPRGRRVEVKWVHKDQELRNCQIVFVSRSEAKRYTKLLQAIEGAGILTVGETPDFLVAGGMISFAVERDTLQFEVNLLAADSARLKISSRLLTLARRVVNRAEAAKS